MPITREHELHRRRFSRNLGLGLVLGAVVALVFVLTLVKISTLDGGLMGLTAPGTGSEGRP
jgi:hypothetical protein